MSRTRPSNGERAPRRSVFLFLRHAPGKHRTGNRTLDAGTARPGLNDRQERPKPLRRQLVVHELLTMTVRPDRVPLRNCNRQSFALFGSPVSVYARPNLLPGPASDRNDGLATCTRRLVTRTNDKRSRRLGKSPGGDQTLGTSEHAGSAQGGGTSGSRLGDRDLTRWHQQGRASPAYLSSTVRLCASGTLLQPV
jgi:hypothetical protein